MSLTEIRSARLTLHTLTEADIDSTWQYRQREEVATWTAAYFTSRDQWEEFVRDPRAIRLAIETHDGTLVGDASIAVTDAWAQLGADASPAQRSQAELGWSIDPLHAGRGYASEAARELLRFCFDQLGVRRVTASAFADNAASIRVMQKIGMRHEGTTRADSLHATRGWTDGAWYAVLAGEWRAAQG